MRLRKFPFRDLDGIEIGTQYIMRQVAECGREAAIRVIVSNELPRPVAAKFVMDERAKLREFVRTASP